MALPVLNAAKYKTVIPSTGQEIEYRPYLVKEEKILMIAMESKDQKQIITAMKDVIRNCVFDDIKVNRLTTFDVEALLVKLRSKSVGETTEVKVKCEKCEAENTQEINFEEIEMPIVTKKENKIQLTDDVGVVLRYPSITALEKQNENDSDVENMLVTIIDSIESIYDSQQIYPAADESKKDLKAFIDSLNSQQFKLLVDYFEDMPALKHNIEFCCAKCGHDNKVELKGLDNFFG